MATVEVVPGIFRIEAPLGDRVFCAFLLKGPQRSILVDTGVRATPGETLLPALDALGVEPDLVVISHADFDHHGGNAPVRAALPDASFACHPADRAQIEDPELLIAERYGEFVPLYGAAPDPASEEEIRSATTAVPIDRELCGGERLYLDGDRPVDVLHVPGHSRGHLAFFDPLTRSALIADAVLGDTLRTAAGEPAFPPTYRYVSDYRKTIQRICALGAERLVTSHFPVIEGRDEVDAFLALSAAFADDVEALLLARLAEAPEPQTMSQLVAALAPQLGPWSEQASVYLMHPLAGHLEELILSGQLVRHGGRAGVPPRFDAAAQPLHPIH